MFPGSRKGFPPSSTHECDRNGSFTTPTQHVADQLFAIETKRTNANDNSKQILDWRTAPHAMLAVTYLREHALLHEGNSTDHWKWRNSNNKLYSYSKYTLQTFYIKLGKNWLFVASGVHDGTASWWWEGQPLYH